MTPVLTPFLLAAALQSAAGEALSSDLEALVTLQRGDEACDLLAAPSQALLAAAIDRSRDDLVLAGTRPETLDRLTARIVAPACDSADLGVLHGAHQARIEALSSYTELTFPGRVGAWRVDRTPPRGARARPEWRVVQTGQTGMARFGVFDAGQGPQLALAFRSNERPARAELMFRDRRRLAHPVDFSAGGLLSAPDGQAAAAWGAGADGQTRSAATARLETELAAALAPANGEPARGFLFNDGVLSQLSQLTPREGFAIVFYDPSGRVSARHWFEVGSLRAAMAMQALPWVEIERAASETR